MKKTIIVIFTCAIIASAITPDALNHNPDNIFYANPWMGEIKLRANKGSILEAYVLHADKRTKMNLSFQENKYDYFTADIGRFDSNLVYQILVRDANDSLILPQNGKFRCIQPIFSVPEWTYGKIYYSIFPDGFFNSRKTNDPDGVVTWGRTADKEYFYGGDLAGIIEKLPYLDSLDFDVLFLQPIISANSNHKYNPGDYAMLDPGFGDTTELKTLISEIHKAKKRIVLKFIATHTGYNFPAFSDIVKNGTTSKYYSWYLINTLPIKTSPPTYECWLEDGRFPRLNLKDMLLRAYLIGYIDYWLHFGFDGVYIGEDPKIEADFVRDLKNTLRKKYPGMIVSGCSDNVGVNGFDATVNRKISELVVKYFVKNTIATSDFDIELRRILFYTPAQVNLANLIDLSDFEKRITSLTDMNNLLLIYAFIFTFCGSPVITYGDEIGMTEGRLFNMGSFPWEAQKQNRNLLEEIKKLIIIRKTNPLLNNKYFYTLYVNDINQVYAYDRGGIITIINSGINQTYTVLPVWNGTYTDLTTGDKIIITTQQLRLSIPGKTFKIIRREF
ncbi:MAG: alpha-amylase family glycosyl hydrolase [bacterium]